MILHLANGTDVASLHCVAVLPHLCAVGPSPHGEAALYEALQRFIINPDLTTAQQQLLSAVLTAFTDCFDTSSMAGRKSIANHGIITNAATPPVYQRPYRMSPKDRAVIKAQVDGMLADDVQP